MKRLTQELEVNLEHGVYWSGVLRIASNNKQAKTWRKRDGVRWLGSEEVPKAYHAPFGGFLVEGGGWLEPHKLLSSLVTAAERNGAKVVEHCEVEEVCERGSYGDDSYQNNSYREVKTSKQTVQAQTLVFCTGANPEFSAKLGVGGSSTSPVRLSDSKQKYIYLTLWQARFTERKEVNTSTWAATTAPLSRQTRPRRGNFSEREDGLSRRLKGLSGSRAGPASAPKHRTTYPLFKRCVRTSGFLAHSLGAASCAPHTSPRS